jgi:hypothetical protein
VCVAIGAGPWPLRRSLRASIHSRNPLVGGHWPARGVSYFEDFTCFSVNGQREVASQCVKFSQSEIKYMHTMCNRPGCRRRLRSHFDEQRDCDEGNNHQSGTSDEHVTDMISCGARAHGYLVAFSDDRTFVRIHWEASFLGATRPIARNSGTPSLFRVLRPLILRPLTRSAHISP